MLITSVLGLRDDVSGGGRDEDCAGDSSDLVGGDGGGRVGLGGDCCRDPAGGAGGRDRTRDGTGPTALRTGSCGSSEDILVGVCVWLLLSSDLRCGSSVGSRRSPIL